MNFKPIELQIAIPKSGEVLQLQQHPSQRSIAEHAVMAGQMEKTADDKLKKPQNVEETEHNQIRGDGGSKERPPRQKQGRKKAPSPVPQNERQSHPFKGRYIDLKL